MMISTQDIQKLPVTYQCDCIHKMSRQFRAFVVFRRREIYKLL